MAQKNFTQMPTKKLNALLATASDEDKVLIEKVLEQRNVAKDAIPNTISAELTQEEQEAIEKAENSTSHSQNAVAKKQVTTKEPKMTDEQREALANELRGTVVNHRCSVVPFNTLEWVEGVIVGIIEEKRTNKVLYAVKTDDGRRIVKAYGSDLIKISDEVVEPIKKSRGRKTKLDENGNPITKVIGLWSDDDIEKAINEVIGNVGKTVSYPKTGAMGVVIEGVTETGRIVSLVPNKRQHTILYRIEVDQPNATEDSEKKYAHKVSSNTNLIIAEDLDEIGKKINESFVNRHNNISVKVKRTPIEVLNDAKAAVLKAEENVEKANAVLEKRKQALEAAQATYNNSIDGDSAQNNNEDLM